MSSRKEEERNEKIIRGLMKLPPNRRCINCNSLGPQYVCTNFWTFICMTCSGIHREFTHRVKSVSMAKFSAQEVEALQKGGNQRARDIFLKDWDQQRQRFPDSSNADKVREFIKSVYVDKKYAGARTSDRPPRDVQNSRNHEDEVRRASSYHSYSQSPPYDFQYEERRYGKHASVLTRKPGSDRGLYDGKISSFSSPSPSSDHMYEDRFANEGCNSRISDYSLSSGGDPFRSALQSPNFQWDNEFGSLGETSRNILRKDLCDHSLGTLLDVNDKKDADVLPYPQRAASSGRVGSFDNTSVNSVSLADSASEPEKSVGTHYNKLSTLPSLPRSSVSGNSDAFNLFNVPLVPQPVTPKYSAVDLFNFPEASPTQHVDLSHSHLSPVPTFNANQPPQISPFSTDLFSEMALQQPIATLSGSSREAFVTENEGWATFETPEHMEASVKNFRPAKSPSDVGSDGNSDLLSSFNTSVQWPPFYAFGAHDPSPLPNPGHDNPCNAVSSFNATSTQSWNAFEDSTELLTVQNIRKNNEKAVMHNPSDEHLSSDLSKDFNKEGIQTLVFNDVPPIPSIPSDDSSALAVMAGSHSHAANCISSNPFDLPSDFENNNKLLDMKSLQAALPDGQLPSSFINSVTPPWFPQNPATPYIPGQLGALGFMAGQPQTTQIPSITTQGPVASMGGNPFA